MNVIVPQNMTQSLLSKCFSIYYLISA